MNIERAMIAYAISGIISQRLVRKVCQSCAASYQPSDKLLKHFGLRPDEQQFVAGKGCDKCDNSGYYGRTGVFEVFEFDEIIRSLIVSNVPMRELEAYMEKSGMKSLRDAALGKVRNNITTLEEISRIVS